MKTDNRDLYMNTLRSIDVFDARPTTRTRDSVPRCHICFRVTGRSVLSLLVTVISLRFLCDIDLYANPFSYRLLFFKLFLRLLFTQKPLSKLRLRLWLSPTLNTTPRPYLRRPLPFPNPPTRAVSLLPLLSSALPLPLPTSLVRPLSK